MIVSFHPLFAADRQILCAGREPDQNDRAWMRRASALILPQAAPEALYRMAVESCAHIFPDYRARLAYPGKLGQVRLFRKYHVPHPKTLLFPEAKSFYRAYRFPDIRLPFPFPTVFKLDWGGEGKTVSLIETPTDLQEAVEEAMKFETAGSPGFLLQERIPSRGRTLRVVVVGETLISYWRIQADPSVFGTSLADGACLDADSDPGLQATGRNAVRHFCRRSGINLAGFDLIFSAEQSMTDPLFLEINYFFGRQGIGGSQAYYGLLEQEIIQWLEGLSIPVGSSLNPDSELPDLPFSTEDTNETK